MSTEDPNSRLLRFWQSRRNRIVRSWHEAIVHTSFTALSTYEERSQLERLTDQVIDLLVGEPFEPHKARNIGVSLAHMHYLSEEAISKTQEALGRGLLKDLPQNQMERMPPRIVAVLSELAAGYFGQSREMILADQEEVNAALLRERNLTEEALRRSEATLAEAQRIAHVGHWEYDFDEDRIRWSDEIYQIFGVSHEEFGETLDAYLSLVHPDDIDIMARAGQEAMQRGDQVAYEHRIRRPSGEVRNIQQHMELVFDRSRLPSESLVPGEAREDKGQGKEGYFGQVRAAIRQLIELTGGPVRLLGTVQDITEGKALEMRLEYQALHDSLTDLPNRVLFQDRLEHALARAERGTDKVHVLFIDLDNFKLINDSLGHAAGDQLLTEFADRLRSSVRPQDTVARFGGDEFTVLIEDSSGEQGATAAAQRILRTLGAPLYVLGHEIFATASIGISSSALENPNPERLLRDADAAMYQAKASGRSRYEVFKTDMNVQALESLKLEGELRRALEQDQFVLYYQPKLELASGRVAGMEALVRWEHPDRGLLLPHEFLETAEKSELLLALGRWVLEEACHQAQAWQQQYPSDTPLIVSVNLSASQLQQPGLYREIVEALNTSGVSPEALELEITEDVAMKDVYTTSAKIQEFKALGFRLAIDDFGTGHSSLSYLKHLPVDSVKLDRSFIEGLGKNYRDTLIVSATINLGQALGLQVVAEGVETAEQCVKLQELGCDQAQGYFFAKPQTSDGASALLEDSQNSQ